MLETAFGCVLAEKRVDDGHENDERSPWAGRREYAGAVGNRKQAEKGDVMDKTDQGAEGDGAKSGNDADNNRQERQPQQPHAL